MATLHGIGLQEISATRQISILYTPEALPEESQAPPDTDAIHALLAEQGFGECELDAAAIEAFAARCAEARAPCEAIIGTRRDGTISIVLADDQMTAWLTMQAAKGGQPLAADKIRLEVWAKGIIHGVDETALEEAIAAGECENLVIAAGTPPIEGEPARFESLLESLRASRSDTEGQDIIDYRNLGDLLLVPAGTPLMRRIPAVPGQEGINVLGRPVSAPFIADTPFARPLSGVTPDQQDVNLLLAEIAGQPAAVERGVIVNPVVEIENVDMHSGNVLFDGTLKVKGDVHAGMSIKVAGDVIVGGAVEAARIVAGGNVAVKGGIVGKAEAPGETGRSARIECNGSVQAHFIEYAHIEAGQSILVESAVRQSDLMAGLQIAVGRSASQGQIIGGHNRALIGVRAATLGSPSGTSTLVQVGIDPRLHAKRSVTEKLRRHKVDECAKMRQLLEFFDLHPEKGRGGVRERVEASLAHGMADIVEFDLQLEALAEQMALAEGASIEVSKAIYGGVSLQVGHKLKQVFDNRGGLKLRLVEGEIIER